MAIIVFCDFESDAYNVSLHSYRLYVKTDGYIAYID